MFYLSLLVLFFITLFTNNGVELMPKVPNIKDFLQKIQQIESSGGKNLEHPTVEGGIQAGDQAIGRYGLMPNTIKELVNRRRLEGTSTPELQDLSQIDGQSMKQHIEANP